MISHDYASGTSGSSPTHDSPPSDELSPPSDELPSPAELPAELTRTDATGRLQGQADTRNPRDLDEHPLCRRLFPDLGTDDQNEEMAGSVAKLQRSAVWITGRDCEGTPPNVVLDGRRVRRAALKANVESVDVIVFDDLTEDEQVELIVHRELGGGVGPPPRRTAKGCSGALPSSSELANGRGCGLPRPAKEVPRRVGSGRPQWRRR